jgi:glutathione synthase/RimK-type ligase-like ATP-grasp enzyme
MLDMASIPVCQWSICVTEEDLTETIISGYPIVLKPLDGNHGKELPSMLVGKMLFLVCTQEYRTTNHR